jgi:hypothetical protein
MKTLATEQTALTRAAQYAGVFVFPEGSSEGLIAYLLSSEIQLESLQN